MVSDGVYPFHRFHDGLQFIDRNADLGRHFFAQFHEVGLPCDIHQPGKLCVFGQDIGIFGVVKPVLYTCKVH